MDIVQRKVKSEHNSPILGPQKTAVNPSIRDLAIPSFDPSAYSYSPFATDSPGTLPNSLQNSQNASQQDLTLPERFPETWFMTYEQAHEYEPPPGSRHNDVSSVDWSTFNLDGNNNLYNTNKRNSPYLSQQSPFQTYDLSNQINQVGLTSSSGDVSEVEDQSPPSNRWGSDHPVNNDRQTSLDAYNDLGSIAGDDTSDRYRLSSASSHYGTPQTNILASDNLGSLDIDDYLKQAEIETKRMQMQQQMAQMQMAQQEAQQQSRMSSVSRGLTPSISTPSSTANVETPIYDK